MSKKQTNPRIVDLNAPCDEFGNTQPRVRDNWAVYDEEGSIIYAAESYWDALEVLQEEVQAYHYERERSLRNLFSASYYGEYE